MFSADSKVAPAFD